MIEKSNFVEITILVENFDGITVYEDNRNGLRGQYIELFSWNNICIANWIVNISFCNSFNNYMSRLADEFLIFLF